MSVIVNNLLLVRRINDLHRKRKAVVARQDELRSVLPDWTFAPLRLAGLSSREIDAMVLEAAAGATPDGVVDLELELERLDQQIEEAENRLISSPDKSLECIETVLTLAVDRLRRQISTNPADVLYDYGEARIMFMLESVVNDLREQATMGRQAAG